MTVTAPSMAGKVSRGLIWSTVSNLVLRSGNLLVSIIMARLIAPEQFGVFAVALTVWTILSSLAEFGLTADLIRARNVESRIPTVATVGLAISGLLALGMAASASAIAASFGSPESAGVIRVMSLSLVIIGLSVVPSAMLQRAIRQAAIFAINGTALVVSTSTMTVMALMGFGPMALAWGQIAGQLVAMLAQYLVAGRRPRFGFDREVARQSARFSFPLALANLLSWALLGVDNFIVARVMSPIELGFYVLAFNVSSWPMSAIGSAIRAVALPAFSHLETQRDRNEALVRASGSLWSICVLMSVLLGALAGPLIAFLYGARWMAATSALIGLAAFGGLRVAFDMIATFLIAAGSTRAVLVVQVWWFAVLIPAMFFAVHQFGLLGAGWMHLVVGVVAVLPAYVICLRSVGVDCAAFLRAWIKPTVFIIPAAAACWWLGRMHMPAVVSLLAGCGAALILYVLPTAPWFMGQMRSMKRLVNGEDPAAGIPS